MRHTRQEATFSPRSRRYPWVVLVAVLVALAGCEQAVDERDLVLSELKNQSWLPPAKECPADVAPPIDIKPEYLGDYCEANLYDCLRSCEREDGNACYALALASQQFEFPDHFVETLFLRSCRLGIMSGCTNRAAGMLRFDEAQKRDINCILETFDKMCIRDDPWACTMLGQLLIKGPDVDPDLRRALEVLPKGCRHGDEDPACQRAKELTEQAELKLRDKSNQHD